MSNLIALVSANPKVFIIIGALLVILLLIFLINKIGLKWINITESIVVFIEKNLIQLGISNEKLTLIIQLISEAITSASIIVSDSDNDIKTIDAVGFIMDICKDLNVVISDDEKNTITTVVKLVFIFMSTLNIMPAKLSHAKILRVNTKLAVARRNE